MIPIPHLKFGYNDAENYKRKENKEIFNNFFIRTNDLEKLCENNIFFLIGEKGTGKTAYAVYISNNEYHGNTGVHKHIRETDYQKFIRLKLDNHLFLSDYTNIWSVIIYFLLSQQIIDKEKERLFIDKYWKFRGIRNAINEFYNDAFSPEIIYAINFVEDSKLAAELITKNLITEGKADVGKRREVAFAEQKFQMNLYYIQKKFEDALSSLSLNKNHILFIDGIDVRPSGVPFEEYLDCVKGLANAAWSINNDFFSSIKDSKGRLRVVLLLRPDIFESLGLQNQNNKLRDNSVLLDWRTKLQTYRTSSIFGVADNILKVQQTSDTKKSLNLGDAWDYYFPYDVKKKFEETSDRPTAFIDFLRYSLLRPRDIITMLDILQNNFKNNGKNLDDVFSIDDFQDPDFQDQLSAYYLREIKDELSFYYSEEDYRIFLLFFPFLKGSSRFSYERYKAVYFLYYDYIIKGKSKIPTFCENEDTFLQFLYDLNIICYIENTSTGEMFRWCYRERKYGNISPKVRTYANYFIHYGMRKALNIGKVIL